MTNQYIARTLAKQGSELSPESLELVHSLYAPEQRDLAHRVPATSTDISYGPDERQKLDIYRPRDAKAAPVLVFVHGGGFLRGDKGEGIGERWQNANVGRMAAQRGMVGVVINYRLAPENIWPSGSEDIAMAVDWLRANIDGHGGDPEKIVFLGTSAGAAHVAGYLKYRPNHSEEIRGAAFLSGVYGIAPMIDRRDTSYFGKDLSHHAEMVPLEAVVKTRLPLLICSAQFDPPRFQEEFIGVLSRRLDLHDELPRTYVGSGHNHFSMAYHLGSSDRRLANEIEWFVDDCTRS